MATILNPGDYTVPVPLPPPPPIIVNTTILLALQIAPFELLWGVGRSHPVPNPPTHGTALWTPGEPATCDFRPVKLNGDSDNVYCLRRLGQYIPPSLAVATQFTESQTLQVNDPVAVQALETDWHVQIGTKVWNPGLQLLPGKPWQVRGFDYINKKWVSLGINFDGNLLLAGLTLSADYTFTPASLVFNAVSLNGTKHPITFTQPVATAANAAIVFNKAIQCDARSDALPYSVKIGQMVVAYS